MFKNVTVGIALEMRYKYMMYIVEESYLEYLLTCEKYRNKLVDLAIRDKIKEEVKAKDVEWVDKIPEEFTDLDIYE